MDKDTRVYLAVFVSKENGVIGARAYDDETRCREAATAFEAALPGNYTRLYNEPIR